MIILLNLPTSEWTTAHARYIFRKGGSGTVTFDMYTSTDHLWQYLYHKASSHARPRRTSYARIIFTWFIIKENHVSAAS